MSKLTELSLKDYITLLGDRVPAPGGGSAAAVLLCCAIALYRKSLLYSSKNFDRESFESISSSLKSNIDNALLLIDKDRDAYLALKETINKGDAGPDQLKRGYIKAAAVPLEAVKTALETLGLIESSSVKIKRCFLSDVAGAIYFLEAAFDSALNFVRINLRSIDRSFEEFSGFNRADIERIKSRFKKINEGLEDE
jgi:methenyltetrahydrofolate cyclohydrolase